MQQDAFRTSLQKIFFLSDMHGAQSSGSVSEPFDLCPVSSQESSLAFG